MKTSPNLFRRLWKWWFTPRSTDPTLAYRELALRALLPVIALLRPISLLRNYSGDPGMFPATTPVWLHLAFFVISIYLSFYFLTRQKVDKAGMFFILHWYLADLLSLQTEGYWYPGYQISLIMQIILGTLFLPSQAILLFLIFQIVTVGIWGNWLFIQVGDRYPDFRPAPVRYEQSLGTVHRQPILVTAGRQAGLVRHRFL